MSTVDGLLLLHWHVRLCCYILFNPSMGTLKLQSDSPLYSSMAISTLVADGWAVTFGTARRGLGGLWPHPVPSSLYQMYQPTHQRPVYELHIIRCGTVITSAH